MKRWSLPKKLVYKGKDIHAGCDRIIFPIHRPSHWTCAMVDVAGKRIVYLDSMSNGGEDPEVPEALAEWYKLDRAEKKKEDLPVDEWPIDGDGFAGSGLRVLSGVRIFKDIPRLGVSRHGKGHFSVGSYMRGGLWVLLS